MKPVLEIDSVDYRVDNVTVTVMWTEDVGVNYNVQILPSVPLHFNESTCVQMVLLYNTEYTMSIRAATPCTNSTLTSYIILSYSKYSIYTIIIIVSVTIFFSLTHELLIACSIIDNCGDPLANVSDSTVRIVDYSDKLTLEGTTVNFSCPSGLIIDGIKQSTCMSDGRWEPDPNESACIGIVSF